MRSEPDPTQRFADRVENYVRYRPGYPLEITETLAQECGLTASSLIADVGCGPGNLARIFLGNGNRVIGVEPNQEMRNAAVRELATFGSLFSAVDGRAENTGLAAASIDFVTAGQAFHWFDPMQARAEFQRILRPDGWCALVWNEQHPDSAFLNEYERLLIRYGRDYERVRSKRNAADEVTRFFAPAAVRRRQFRYAQNFDFEGLTGRLVSSSYAPQPGDESYAEMIAALRDVFDRHAEDGRVPFEYQTFLYWGRPGRSNV